MVRRYRAGLTVLLRRQLHDPSRAEDLCQEVFGIALPALRAGRLQDGGKLAAYLRGIARNLASRERRGRVRDPRAESLDAIPDPGPRPDQQLIDAERATLVRRALGTLSARDRAVLTAYYLSDAPKEDVCRRLGIAAAQFDLIKWRALKRLLRAWRSAEKPPPLSGG